MEREQPRQVHRGDVAERRQRQPRQCLPASSTSAACANARDHRGAHERGDQHGEADCDGRQDQTTELGRLVAVDERGAPRFGGCGRRRNGERSPAHRGGTRGVEHVEDGRPDVHELHVAGALRRARAHEAGADAGCAQSRRPSGHARPDSTRGHDDALHRSRDRTPRATRRRAGRCSPAHRRGSRPARRRSGAWRRRRPARDPRPRRARPNDRSTRRGRRRRRRPGRDAHRTAPRGRAAAGRPTPIHRARSHPHP